MKLAGHKNPTLCEYIVEIENLMTEWEKMGEDTAEIYRDIQKGLDKITEYYVRMDKCNAYVIAMGMSYSRLPKIRLT